MGEESILMQVGKKHAAQRRLLGQAFTREAVDGYAPLVEGAVRANLERWADEGSVRGMAAGKDLAFEVAARALVASGGENGGEDDDMSQETMEAFRRDFDRFVVSYALFSLSLSLSSLLFLSSLFSLFPRKKVERKLQKKGGLI